MKPVRRRMPDPGMPPVGPPEGGLTSDGLRECVRRGVLVGMVFTLAACSTRVAIDADVDADASVDVLDDALDRSDAMDVAPRDDGSADRVDVPACLGGESGIPPGLNQSCAPGTGVDPEYCREVHFEADTYMMGQEGAWDQALELSHPPESDAGTMRWCDVHPGAVRAGQIDAYEVTVSRFRQWVQAGMPKPAVGDTFFNGYRWSDGTMEGWPFDADVRLPTVANYSNDVPGSMVGSEACTYSPTPGTNDNLPVNCVTLATAAAFCWWDGKHVVSESVWEYVARNRGTTDAPFGAIDGAAGSAACSLGDVGAFTGDCAVEGMPQPVGMHPSGDSMDPPGVHDLYGGLQEWTFGGLDPYAGPCMQATIHPETLDGRFETAQLRGNAWFMSTAFHALFARAASRTPGFYETGNLTSAPWAVPRYGIRCARWDCEIH